MGGVRQISALVKYFLVKNKKFFLKFYFFFFFSILSHKISLCQILNLFQKIIKNNASSPRLNAFDIYIEYASDKGEITIFHIANYSVIYIFYAAYSFMYKYKNLVNAASTTGSGTKENASDAANTPY